MPCIRLRATPDGTTGKFRDQRVRRVADLPMDGLVHGDDCALFIDVVRVEGRAVHPPREIVPNAWRECAGVVGNDPVYVTASAECARMVG